MTDPVHTAASGALTELLEVSPQVDAAVIVERDGGRLLAGAPVTNDTHAERLGSICASVLEAAEQARTELGREPVAQVEVATPEGHVFVVADTTWVVAAVTDADPTVGLVFYDLKTALRAVREARAAANGSGSAPLAAASIVTALQEETDDREDQEAGAADEADSREGHE